MAEEAHIEHKKVELVELFFDLVLVYAISQTTGLIHHLHRGVLANSVPEVRKVPNSYAPDASYASWVLRTVGS